MKYKKLGYLSIAALSGFVIFSIIMFFNFDNTLDRDITVFFVENRTSFLNGFFMIATELSGVYVVIGICIIFLILFKLNKKSIFISIAALVSFLGNYLIKLIFMRPRPDDIYHLVEEGTTSYPSGHATISCCFYLFLAYVLSKKYPKLSKVFIACSLGIIALVSLSRIYLGVHYFTDIIGGLICGVWMFSGLVYLMLIIKKKAKPANSEQ